MAMRSLLDAAPLYRLFTYLIGGYDVRRTWIKKHVRPWAGARVLDMGCGPADMLEAMSGVRYTGFDPNQAYIRHARDRWGDQGVFVHKNIGEVADNEFADQDLVLAFGVLHHLSDEQADELFRVAYRSLKEGGRLITLDGCYREGQGWLERFLLRHDRGKFVRSEKHYLALAEKRFSSITRTFDCAKLRLPYCTLTMECRK